jgi:ribosomal protein S18 acetylase RimI-like enzyme
VLACSLRQNTALISDIERHFTFLDEKFTQELSARVEISEYIRKIRTKAQTLEIWTDQGSLECLDALLAYFVNTAAKELFITHLSVTEDRYGLGFASSLIRTLIMFPQKEESIKFRKISLEVTSENFRAINLYKRFEFSICGQNESLLKMERAL